jgi:hypothetical protein
VVIFAESVIKKQSIGSEQKRGRIPKGTKWQRKCRQHLEAICSGSKDSALSRNYNRKKLLMQIRLVKMMCLMRRLSWMWRKRTWSKLISLRTIISSKNTSKCYLTTSRWEVFRAHKCLEQLVRLEKSLLVCHHWRHQVLACRPQTSVSTMQSGHLIKMRRSSTLTLLESLALVLVEVNRGRKLIASEAVRATVATSRKSWTKMTCQKLTIRATPEACLIKSHQLSCKTT